MGVEGITITLILLTFAIYIGIGLWSKVADTSHFFVAGNEIPAIANGAAVAADWMSAASFISMAGLIAFMGYDGAVYLLGWTGGYVLLALLLAPYLRKFGKYTVPDFIGDRYYSDTARGVAALATIFISLTYVAGQMRGVGIVFSRYLEPLINQIIPPGSQLALQIDQFVRPETPGDVYIVVGVIIGMIVVAFFSVLGGMKGITWTQVVQYSIFMAAYAIPAIAISMKLTGNPIPQLGMVFDDIGPRLNELQADLNREYLVPFEGMSMLNVFAVTAALMVGTAGLPHVIIRFYTVRSVRAARYSAGWALLFIVLLYTTAPAIAIFAKYNLLNEINGEKVETVREKGWFSKWAETGLIKIKDKNNDGLVQWRAEGDPANELTKIDQDIVVLSTPEVAQLSPFIIALVAAGGLAAALSTASGLLLAMSSAVSHDVYYRILNPDASERKRLFVGRLWIFLAILVAGGFGIWPPGFVGEVVAFAFGLAAASLFPVILLGIFDRRMNREGAIAGIMSGLIFTFVMISLMRAHAITDVQEPYVSSFFGINAQGVGIVGMVINFIVSYVVSRMTEPPPEEIQDLVERVRMPDVQEGT